MIAAWFWAAKDPEDPAKCSMSAKQQVETPMAAKIDSLNVASAAAVILYGIGRQRKMRGLMRIKE